MSVTDNPENRQPTTDNRMSIQPLARLRLRLTLWYTGTLGLILLLLGGGLFLVIRTQVSQRLDASLADATAALARAAGLREIEHAVASTYPGIDEHLIIARVVKQKSAGATQGSVLVTCSDGGPREFRDISTLFKSIDVAIQDQFLQIYAPQEWAEADKKRKREDFRQTILPLVNDLLKARAGLFRDTTTPEASKREDRQ